MVTIRLFGLDGYTLVRFEGEPPPESSLWTDLGARTLREDQLKGLLARIERQNARAKAGGGAFSC